MNGSTVYATLLRKDLRLFWLFAALVGGLVFLLRIEYITDALGQVTGLVELVLQIGMFLLVLLVCYEDAVVSLKHDWLTRPIPGLTQLLAKATFVLLALVAPAVLGEILNALVTGKSLGEALLTGWGEGAGAGVLFAITVIMAFAAVTGGIRQGMIVFLVGIVIVAVLGLSAVGASGIGNIIGLSGSSWVLARPATLMMFLVAVSVLVIQYRYRDTNASRVLVGATLAAGFLFVMFMTWPRVFAVQKELSPDPASASMVRLSLAEGCFTTRTFESDYKPTGTGEEITPDQYFEQQRSNAGPGAIAIATKLLREEIPAGHRLVTTSVRVSWRSSLGHASNAWPGTLRARRTVLPNGAMSVEHFWLLPKDDYDRLATDAGMQTHIDYTFALMAPKATATFAADGQRAFYKGIGYCSADLDRPTGDIRVECFKAGVQPDQLVASLEGAPELQEVPDGTPDFTPTLLDLWGSRSHKMKLHAPADTAPRVTVTAYEARAHVDRSYTVPGVLGGPVSACPAP